MKYPVRRVVRTLSVALFLLGWQGASMLNVRRQFLNPILFPSPLDMVRAAYAESTEGILWRDIAASLARIFQGFGIGALIAIPLGCATGYFRRLDDWVDPIVELFRPIPPLALLPLFIIWLGRPTRSTSGPPSPSAPTAGRSSATSSSGRRCPTSSSASGSASPWASSSWWPPS